MEDSGNKGSWNWALGIESLPIEKMTESQKWEAVATHLEAITVVGMMSALLAYPISARHWIKRYSLALQLCSPERAMEALSQLQFLTEMSATERTQLPKRS